MLYFYDSIDNIIDKHSLQLLTQHSNQQLV